MVRVPEFVLHQEDQIFQTRHLREESEAVSVIIIYGSAPSGPAKVIVIADCQGLDAVHRSESNLGTKDAKRIESVRTEVILRIEDEHRFIVQLRTSLE